MTIINEIAELRAQLASERQLREAAEAKVSAVRSAMRDHSCYGYCGVCLENVVRAERAESSLAEREKEIHALTVTIWGLKEERDPMLQALKAIAYDDADTSFTVPENRCQAHHSSMALDALKQSYEASGDADKP